MGRRHTASSRELTEEERTALRTALEAGYFAVPRRISTVELAECLETSSSTLVERLRRGTAKLAVTQLETD
ncbi:helix-turn-helix domain-containing protein [Halomarina salina]|uniref:Helix-turn-helix domain-containing protein n=1 Tax=Halomarina salina TaxID=1872699 RepID=A0ABD5RNP9_9EURY|nr:helix-turn-helix domain-containing protein [Halomarina salina]